MIRGAAIGVLILAALGFGAHGFDAVAVGLTLAALGAALVDA